MLAFLFVRWISYRNTCSLKVYFFHCLLNKDLKLCSKFGQLSSGRIFKLPLYQPHRVFKKRTPNEIFPAMEKNRKENGRRAENLGVNPHSKGLCFSRFKTSFIDSKLPTHGQKRADLKADELSDVRALSFLSFHGGTKKRHSPLPDWSSSSWTASTCSRIRSSSSFTFLLLFIKQNMKSKSFVRMRK